MASPGLNGHRYRQLREHVKSTQNICWICGDPIPRDVQWPDPLSFSLDHVAPRQQRPDLAHDPRNAKAAHLGCNSRRGNGSRRRRRQAGKRARGARQPTGPPTPRSRRW